MSKYSSHYDGGGSITFQVTLEFCYEIHHWGAAAHNATCFMSFTGWLWVAVVTGLLEADFQFVMLRDTEGSVELKDGR